MRALVLGALGRAGDARAALLAAVDLARPGGFLRPFLDLGPRMREALDQLARQEDFPGLPTVRRILAEFGDQPTDPAQGGQEVNRPIRVLPPGSTAGEEFSLQPLVEPLTPREIEVLMLMQAPLSFKEIARGLCISYNTAKRHSINIYGKLGVNKRRAAVARAAALGLIPPR
jgi:LuxR family maltose regulon positive regulatory protein